MAEIVLAGCIIRNAKGEVLLLHRKVSPVQWELPGGKVELGEDPPSAAKREIAEELKCEVDVSDRPVGEAQFTEDGKVYHYIWFAATLQGSDKPRIGERHKFDELHYWRVEALVGMKNLSLNVQNLLKSGLL